MSLRWKGLAGVAAVLLLGIGHAPAAVAQSNAAALDQAALALRPGQYLWRDLDPDGGAVSVVISIPLQVAYVFRGDTLIGVASASTGRAGHRTPTGAFTVLQKKVFHRSNLYSNAPMPFMQRLTWSGIALHAGHNPGYPASHGCIRLPPAFAKLLYGATALGAPVAVVGGEWSVPDRDEPPPVIIADAGAFGTARFALVTFAEPPPIGALSVRGDETMVPDARLFPPDARRG